MLIMIWLVAAGYAALPAGRTGWGSAGRKGWRNGIVLLVAYVDARSVPDRGRAGAVRP